MRVDRAMNREKYASGDMSYGTLSLVRYPSIIWSHVSL